MLESLFAHEPEGIISEQRTLRRHCFRSISLKLLTELNQ